MWDLNEIADILQTTFLMDFNKQKWLYFDSNFTEVCFWWFNCLYISNDWVNGLVHVCHQAITWTNVGQAPLHHMVSQSHNELSFRQISHLSLFTPLMLETTDDIGCHQPQSHHQSLITLNSRLNGAMHQLLNKSGLNNDSYKKQYIKSYSEEKFNYISSKHWPCYLFCQQGE